MAPSLRELLASTPLSGGNAPYVEALYEQYLHDPQSVDATWRDYFQRLQDGLKPRNGASAEQGRWLLDDHVTLITDAVRREFGL